MLKLTKSLIIGGLFVAAALFTGCADDDGGNHAVPYPPVNPNNPYAYSGLRWAGSFQITDYAAYESMLQSLGVCDQPYTWGIGSAFNHLDCHNYTSVGIELYLQGNTLPTMGSVNMYSYIDGQYYALSATQVTNQVRPTTLNSPDGDGSSLDGFAMFNNDFYGYTNSTVMYRFYGMPSSNELRVEVLHQTYNSVGGTTGNMHLVGSGVIRRF